MCRCCILPTAFDQGDPQSDARHGESRSTCTRRAQRVGGGEIEVDFNTINVKTQYFNEYTGEPLPNHLVRAAMIEEMS